MTGPPPAVATVRAAVRAAVADLPPGTLVLVACSGGADSLALAAATAFVAPRAGLRAGAVVVDHGLQPGSAAVAADAVTACHGLGLEPVHLERVLVDERGAGPEAAARTARLAALGRVAHDTGAVAVLLGHTRDDQAETVLLGLARGAGARSLAGMAPVRGQWRRPLLGLSRSLVRQACAAAGLSGWEDPTNSDPALARTRVRARVLPVLEEQLGPGVGAALARTASMLRADADLLDRLAADLLESARQAAAAVAPSGAAAPGALVLDVVVLAAAPAALRSRALRAAALECGCPATRLSRDHVLAVDALVTAWHGQARVDLPGHRGATRSGGRLHLGPCSRQPPGPAEGMWQAPPVNADDVGTDLQRVLIGAETIASRLAEMAAQVDADYAGRDLLLVGVLKGAVMVMADFVRALHHPVEMDWMAVSSYGSGTRSSGVVRILKDLETDLTGRNVLIVEDIIDSGLTLSWLVANLGTRGPASVEVLTLLRKPGAAKVAVDVRYTGFEIPDEFVVGYGLDYGERYRNLPFIATLAPHVYAT